jgi:hypothetical protein
VNHDQALALSEKAMVLAKRIDHPLTLANVLLHVAIHRIERREPDRALALGEELVELAAPLGFLVCAGAGRFFCGCARADAGNLEAGIAEMETRSPSWRKYPSGSEHPASSCCSPNGSGGSAATTTRSPSSRSA